MICHGRRRQLRLSYLYLLSFSFLLLYPFRLSNHSSYPLSCQHTAWPEVAVIHIIMHTTITDGVLFPSPPVGVLSGQ